LKFSFEVIRDYIAQGTMPPFGDMMTDF